MVLHRDTSSLNCHNCGRTKRLSSSCPECKNTNIVYRGFGTKKIVTELSALFPEAKIARFDADNKKQDSLAKIYPRVHSGEIDILVGTQLLAKGLDLPKLSTAVVVSADMGLNIPDYRANEKVFQLLHQVIGRVGRHINKSYVGVQTLTPSSPVIQLALKQDFPGFYQLTLVERKAGAYPPFRHLLLLTCTYASREKASSVANTAKIELSKLGSQLVVVGPAPSVYERLGGKYRWQLLVKSSSRQKLLEATEQFVENPRWSVELDPVSLL